ncbi:hypothetical protein C8Q70DRAFT_80683 [Cubamyces menziesii]|nr:hypothetical protein C8Q70DRAFT_80683 [Cubamyces menziesii]
MISACTLMLVLYTLNSAQASSQSDRTCFAFATRSFIYFARRDSDDAPASLCCTAVRRRLYQKRPVAKYSPHVPLGWLYQSIRGRTNCDLRERDKSVSLVAKTTSAAVYSDYLHCQSALMKLLLVPRSNELPLGVVEVRHPRREPKLDPATSCTSLRIMRSHLSSTAPRLRRSLARLCYARRSF